MAIGLAIALALIALLFVLPPIYTNEQSSTLKRSVFDEQHMTATRQPDQEQNERMALQDVELDYQLGNLEEQDYLILREEYMQRALITLKERSEHQQSIDQEIEEQLRRMRDTYEQTNS